MHATSPSARSLHSRFLHYDLHGLRGFLANLGSEFFDGSLLLLHHTFKLPPLDLFFRVHTFKRSNPIYHEFLVPRLSVPKSHATKKESAQLF